jgi:amidase
VSFNEYALYDALGLAGLVRCGEISPGELLEEALARTAALNPKINAVIHLMEGSARAAIAAGLPDGPFRGVPFLLKDLIMAYGGEPMRNGSRLFRDFVPPQDEQLGGGGGRGDRTGRGRQRRWRIDPHAGVELRPGRPEAEPRT